MESNDRLKLGLVGGVIVGGGIGWFLARSADPDEERPPILVRYGSIVFESGNSNRPGKKWKKVPSSGRWHQDHDKGKNVEWLAVHLDVDDHTRVYLTREIRIKQGPEEVTVSVDAPGMSNRTALVINGSTFTEDNQAARPRLTHPGVASDGTIVTFLPWKETFEIEWTDQPFWIWPL